MFNARLSSVFAALLVVKGAHAIVPLADKHFAYPNGIPFKVDTDVNQVRGPQLGYNICNSTTEGQSSLCQTSIFNSLDDFCLWAPASLDSVSNTEGEMVAWCTKPGHGTRVIPAGALTGVQFMKTPDYIQVVGFMDQTQLNIIAGDSGGELDPHGADLRGNPKGGIMYSTAWGGSYVQAIEWHNFMGSNTFCLKACDPAGKNAANYCQHIYDRIGCAYNAPSNAQNGVFESCDGDDQDFPGVYVQNGVTMTYTQPPESLGAIQTMPYQPRVPASSNCKAFASSAIFNGQPAATVAPATTTASSSASSSAATSTSKASSTPSTSNRISTTPSPTAASTTPSTGAPSATQSQASAAGTFVVPAMAVVAPFLVVLFL